MLVLPINVTIFHLAYASTTNSRASLLFFTIINIQRPHEELLVFYWAPPPEADRGMLIRYGGY